MIRKRSLPPAPSRGFPARHQTRVRSEPGPNSTTGGKYRAPDFRGAARIKRAQASPHQIRPTWVSCHRLSPGLATELVPPVVSVSKVARTGVVRGTGRWVALNLSCTKVRCPIRICTPVCVCVKRVGVRSTRRSTQGDINFMLCDARGTSSCSMTRVLTTDTSPY